VRSARGVHLVLVLGTGCVSAGSGGGEDGREGGEAAGSAEAREERCVTGTIASEGLPLGPGVRVRPSGAAEVQLDGPLAANVRLLTGTVARVCGARPPAGGRLRAESVALVEVEGMPARLGTLTGEGDGWALDVLPSGERVVLRAVPEELRGRAGHVVWVAGPISEDGSLRVVSYALLEDWR